MTDRRRLGSGRDRGVSTPLGYVLTLSITVVLISVLVLAVGTFVAGQNERVTESELEVLGQRLASDLEATDRLAEATEANAQVGVTSRLPSTVTGHSYRIAVNASGNDEVVLSTTNPDVSVTVAVVTDYPLSNTKLSGGTVEILFDGTQLEVRDA